VERELAFGLHAPEAPDGDVLAQLLHQRLALRLFRGPRLARGGELGQRPGERDEVVVLGHEIGLAVQLDERADFGVWRDERPDRALGRDAAGGLARLGAAFDAQQLLRLFQIAAGLGQRLLALHHGKPGHFPQLLHQACADLCHSVMLLQVEKKGPRPLLFGNSRPIYRAASSSSTSTNSSREAATTSSRDWLRPSSTASAMPRA